MFVHGRRLGLKGVIPTPQLLDGLQVLPPPNEKSSPNTTNPYWDVHGT